MPYMGIFGQELKKKTISYVKSEPSNLSICKILRKNNNTQIWDQKFLIYIVLVWNLEIILSYLKSATSNLSNCKILRKKCLILGQKMPCLGVFAQNFQKTIVIFQINALKFF